MNAVNHKDLLDELESLREKLREANDTLEAIRNGEIDALVVTGEKGQSLFTLQSADRSYRFFVERMAEGALTLNQDGLIIFSNTQFAHLINRPLSNVLGSYFIECVAADDVPIFKSLFMQGWSTNVKHELRIKSADQLIDVQISLNALELDDTTVLSVIVTDLTQQKKIERQLTSTNTQLNVLNSALVSSNDDLQQFASVASHDLQEPLRKIQVFSQFLKDRHYDELSLPAKEYLNKIIGSGQRMKSLIVDILTYSRLSAHEAMSEQVDLNDMLREIIDDFELQIVEKKAIVKVGQLCTVEGNKGQLRQVFYNLISNALKFAAADRPPVVSVELKDLHLTNIDVAIDKEKYCSFAVADNGIGFEKEYSSTIFSLFEKLNPKNTFEGSGIGLAIAKKIIEKHHGSIHADSVQGEGSEFTILLPYKQPSPNTK